MIPNKNILILMLLYFIYVKCNRNYENKKLKKRN